MPYKTNNDLPDRVKKNLPSEAQKIYRKAFNNAYKQYKDPKKRRKGASLEETVHKVAWAAVKKVFKKKFFTGKWVRI